MNRYIDAEKLTTIIEEIKAQQDQWINRYHDPVNQGISNVLTEILSIITSLRREQSPIADASKMEQPEATCKTCGFYENNCPFIRGKLIPYPNKVCKDYNYSAVKEQEQREVDLKKEIEKAWEKFPTKILYYTAFAELVAHFYELGKNSK